MPIITVNGQQVSVRGAEFRDGMLSVPNNRASRKLAKLLRSPVERGKFEGTVKLDDKDLPKGFLFVTRAPSGEPGEG